MSAFRQELAGGWSLAAGLLTCLLLGPAELRGQAVTDPATEHAYEIIAASVDWQTAADLAAAMTSSGLQCHLATVTSAEEQQFLAAELIPVCDGSWIGAQQDPAGAEPDGGWGWLTGEAWQFTAWSQFEPNDFAGNEECAETVAGRDFQWNDLNCDDLRCYLVECEPLSVPAMQGWAVLSLGLLLAAVGAAFLLRFATISRPSAP